MASFEDSAVLLDRAPLPDQADDLIWRILDKQFCSYKTKTQTSEKKVFCRNEYNATGLCSRACCPLANTSYATVRDDGRHITLYIKNPQEQHRPCKMWDRICLDGKSRREAVGLIEEKLAGQKSLIKQKCLIRYDRLLQVRAKKKELKQTADQAVVLAVHSKRDRKMRNRMEKASKVARFEQSIENELLRRLHTGVYGDIYNLDKQAFDEAIEEGQEQMEFVEDDDEDDTEDDALYGEDPEESEEDLEDMLLVRKRK